MEMVTRNIFGPNSKYIADLKKIYFISPFSPSNEEEDRKSWESGKTQAINLLDTMAEELTLFQDTNIHPRQEEQPTLSTANKAIFVVHGHDEAMKVSVARLLEKLGLDPVILHEKPNKGRTIIEKFSDYSDVSFAIVLLSPDDVGREQNVSNEKLRPRARQNVILELGFFLGKLGKERVITLYRKENNFEIPTDYSGVVLVPFDVDGRWQFDIVKELKTAGYPVDANKIL